MSRSFVLSLQRPTESLGLSMSVGQRVARAGGKSWAYLCITIGFVLLGFSIISVNTSAAKTFDIRKLERTSDALTEQVSVLEAQAAVLQSFASLQDRVQGMGYVPAEQVRYLDVK